MFEQYQTPQYATFWHRLAAYVIDWVLAMVIFCPLGMVLGLIGAFAGRGREEVNIAVQVISQVVSLFVSWLYYALMESSSWQGTVGKRVLGVKVADLDGARIGFGRATGRFFAKMIGIVPMILGVLLFFLTGSLVPFIALIIITLLVSLGGYLMVFFTNRSQALHDMLAGTIVVLGAPAGGGVTLDQPPPPPPSDFGQGGGYGGAGGGSYGAGYGG